MGSTFFLSFRGKSLHIDIGQTCFRISAKLWEVVSRPKNYAANIIRSQQLLSDRHAIDFNTQILRERYTCIMSMKKLLSYICPQNIMLYHTLLSKLALLIVYMLNYTGVPFPQSLTIKINSMSVRQKLLTPNNVCSIGFWSTNNFPKFGWNPKTGLSNIDVQRFTSKT